MTNPNELTEQEYRQLWGEPTNEPRHVTDERPPPNRRTAVSPPITEEAFPIGTMARAEAAAKDGLARIIYAHPRSLASLLEEAADTLRAGGSDILPGQQRTGRPGSADAAMNRLAELSGVPRTVIAAHLEAALRRTCSLTDGHPQALLALAAARCNDPMSIDVRQAAEHLLGTA